MKAVDRNAELTTIKTAPTNSDAMLINMRTNKVNGIEVNHSAKWHSVEHYFGVCVYVFLAFTEFFQWKNTCNSWTALTRSRDLKGITKAVLNFVHSSLAWEALLKNGKTDTIFFTSEKFRLRPVTGRNYPTNQIQSCYWRIIFIWQLFRVNLSTYIIKGINHCSTRKTCSFSYGHSQSFQSTGSEVACSNSSVNYKWS